MSTITYIPGQIPGPPPPRPQPDINTFGGRLVAVRQSLDLTQTAFAEALEVTNQSLSVWEQDKSIPTKPDGFELVNRIHARFGIDRIWMAWGPAVAAEYGIGSEGRMRGYARVPFGPLQVRRSA